ncbi:C40 family peptidase [Pseudonocardia sp.]|uniref:C40 family peptidase n=1 Tax=Pseudonocardia sp. TaxID=60912 RepID=UPI003D0966F6
MTQRVADATTDAVPVRQVADVILSFGLELPAVPGPRRPDSSSGAHRLAEWPARSHMGPVAEFGVGRTVAVAPEVLAKARRLAFGPPLPPPPAPRAAHDAWAPAADPTTAVPAPRRHHDDVAPHTTVLPLQPRGPVDDDPWAPGATGGATRFVGPRSGPDDEPETDPFGVAATTVTAAADVTTVHRAVPDAEDTALVTQDEPYSDIDRPVTGRTGSPTTLGNAGRGRPTRQLAVVTATMASVAIVGAAAAAVVSLSNSGPSPADNASSDLDLAHQAALPTRPDPVRSPSSAPPSPITQALPTAGAGDRTTASARGDGSSTGAGPSTRATTTTTRAPAAARAVPAVTASGKSAAAAQVALQQVGKPYVWGAAGPSAFDCSGLVHYAFQQMGVTLPRTAAAMSQVGTPVSRSELKPGDLVFFYSPISHVGIYIGDGKVVNATTEGEPVQVSPLSDFPMTSARRV